MIARRGWTPNEAETETVTADHGTANASMAKSRISERERLYARAALDGCGDELAAAPSGTRNDVLYKKAFRLGTMVARGWI